MMADRSDQRFPNLSGGKPQEADVVLWVKGCGFPPWPEAGLALPPQTLKGLKLSKTHCSRKCATFVGLYLNPPDRSLVFCVDEKSRIQALDHNQPLLPMRPGQAERRPPDYLRHGTTHLFAALDLKSGTVAH
jgi:hypothetical protein